MRIHVTDRQAAEAAIDRQLEALGAVTVRRLTWHGSRTHPVALELVLDGSGREGGQWGTLPGKPASWDEWGAMLAGIFAADPATKAGPYISADHFHWHTSGRFHTADGLPTEGLHHWHRWEIQGRSVTGSYLVRECRRSGWCSAQVRDLIGGWTFEELAG